MPDEALVHRVPMRHPGDTSGLERLLDAGEVRAERILAVLGKTEGNGCVNDHTRGYAVLALQSMLAARLGIAREAVADRVAMVMSGGTEGALSPHFTVLSTRAANAAPAGAGALAIGVAYTRDFLPEELGRAAQVDATTEAVREAMRRALIFDAAAVHYVQVKCPLLTAERMADALGRGAAPVTGDSYASMGHSRGASALGVAVALGEVERAAITDAAVLRDLSLWSGRASASAGVELMRNEVLVLGNSSHWVGRARIAHGVMADALDLDAALAVLRTLGLPHAGQLPPGHRDRVLAVLSKADPGSTGRVRGLRHTMLDDSDINATRHARATVGGVLGGAIGRADLFVSGGAEHQGPDGGGPVAVIAEVG